MNLQGNGGKTDLTLSAAPEHRPAVRKGPPAPALIDGLAPNLVGIHIGPTRLCGVCVTLIRQVVATGEWRHCALGLDHDPDPGTYPGITADVVRPWSCSDCQLVNWPPLGGGERTACYGCGSPRVTESELRALAGDR